MPVSSSKESDPVETESDKPSKQGVLQALASMMAEKDVKVSSHMLFDILKRGLIDTEFQNVCRTKKQGLFV